jgi:hypothetical protein
MLCHAAIPAEGGVAARLADRVALGMVTRPACGWTDSDGSLSSARTAACLQQDRDRPEASVKPEVRKLDFSAWGRLHPC